MIKTQDISVKNCGTQSYEQRKTKPMSISFPIGPKSTWQHQAEQIKSGDNPATEKDIPILLEWLKDLNWPGSAIIAEHIPCFGNSLCGPVEQVLLSEDSLWKFGVLNSLSESMGRDFWDKISPAIEKTASCWEPEGAHIGALKILARHNLSRKEIIKTHLDSAKSHPDADPEDYREIELLLKR